MDRFDANGRLLEDTEPDMYARYVLFEDYRKLSQAHVRCCVAVVKAGVKSFGHLEDGIAALAARCEEWRSAHATLLKSHEEMAVELWKRRMDNGT